METKDAIKRMDEIVQLKVNEAIAEERAQHRKTEQELMRTKEYLKVITYYKSFSAFCVTLVPRTSYNMYLIASWEA